MLVCYNLFLKISSQICLLLLFVGLQGSYARGEATEASDIDVVVVLDELYFADLLKYRDMLDTTVLASFLYCCFFINLLQ